MAIVLLDTGSLRITVKHLQKRKGVWFYRRRVPEELRGHYGGKPHILKSLQTGELAEAAVKAAQLAARDDALWKSLRSSDGKEMGLTTPQNRDAALALLTALKLSPGDQYRHSRDPLAEGEEPIEKLEDYLERRYGKAYLEARHNPDTSPEHLLAHWMTPIEAEAVRLLLCCCPRMTGQGHGVERAAMNSRGER